MFLALCITIGPIALRVATADAGPQPIIAADHDFAVAHEFAGEWIGELLFDRQGHVVGQITDVALNDGKASHLIVTLEPLNGMAGEVAVPIARVDTRIELGTRKHVADAALIELRAPLH